MTAFQSEGDRTSAPISPTVRFFFLPPCFLPLFWSSSLRKRLAEHRLLSFPSAQNEIKIKTGYSKEVPFSYVTSLAILDKDVRAESVKLCSSSGKCIDKGEGIITGTQFNVSPFCQEMQPSPTTKKPTLYGGVFVLISE